MSAPRICDAELTQRFRIIFVLWYCLQAVREYWEFFRAYPWIGLLNLWPAIAMNNAYLILDYYGLFTLRTEAWLTRRDQEPVVYFAWRTNKHRV